MIKPIIVNCVKQYLPILLNSICTAVCISLAGCKLTADNLSLEIDSPVSYHSATNSPH